MGWYYKEDNNGKNIFVFGSNLAGIHGAGAALSAAKHWGAKAGVGHGPTGKAYALPTKDRHLRPLPAVTIRSFIRGFYAYARSRPDRTFLVTQIGCGLAGYTRHQIAPLFANPPSNCKLPEEFKRILQIYDD
jgi:hypothetical protein